jgi:hypothetical protein
MHSSDPFHPWSYRRTSLKYDGMTVYKAYFYDEFMGYRYRQRAKQLRMVNGKLKEVNVGWQYVPIPIDVIEN